MMNLNEALSLLTVDQLKQYLAFVPDEQGGGKKADLMQRIANGLAGDKLQAQYQQLDKLQQAAVAEALYDLESCFRPQKFHAKYGESPVFTHKTEGRTIYHASVSSPARIRLFLYSADKYGGGSLRIPVDLAARLQAFVAKPAAARLPVLKELPEAMEDGEPVIVRETEQDALRDVAPMLHLIEAGKLQVSEKTGQPSVTVRRLLDDALSNGDFYKFMPKQDKWGQETGGFKSFAWPLLLQAGKLAQANGKKLALSKAGMRALSKPAADTLRTLWQKWQKTTLLDEFSRIDEIKGQRAKGRVMTALAARREAIQEGLRQCPPGEWVGVDSFFAFMQATELHFDVTHDPWKLYIADVHYGSLGYDGFHGWSVLQGRYILCLLFEYAATLGMVDVAYISPDRARDDFRGLWGTDDIDFLSRYDGLLYFRVTPLGAYCLGQVDAYESPLVNETTHSAGKPKSEELKRLGTAILLECPAESIAATLAEHNPVTAKLCQRAGSKQLVVKLENEEKFREAIRLIGFDLPL